MTNLEQNILARLKKSILRRLPLRELFLFGSRARGDADPDSDMDVLVVLDSPVDSETDEYVSQCAWESGYQDGVVVSPVTFSREEWEESPERFSLLAIAVRQEGVAI